MVLVFIVNKLKQKITIMGAKKDKHIKILTYKEDKFKELAKNFKKYNIDEMKLAAVEAKEAKYKAWKAEIVAKPDY